MRTGAAGQSQPHGLRGLLINATELNWRVATSEHNHTFPNIVPGPEINVCVLKRCQQNVPGVSFHEVSSSNRLWNYAKDKRQRWHEHQKYKKLAPQK